MGINNFLGIYPQHFQLNLYSPLSLYIIMYKLYMNTHGRRIVWELYDDAKTVNNARAKAIRYLSEKDNLDFKGMVIYRGDNLVGEVMRFGKMFAWRSDLDAIIEGKNPTKKLDRLLNKDGSLLKLL